MDVLVGDRGNDFVNGQVGADTELLGSGDDTAAWLPGEGSDDVLGDSGADTLAFTGGTDLVEASIDEPTDRLNIAPATAPTRSP